MGGVLLNLQDVSTRRSLSTVYTVLYAVDKDLRVKTSCIRFIINSCVLLKNLVSVCVNQLLPCLPLHPSPQNGGQSKFPDLVAGASGGTHIPTALTQCTCIHDVLWVHCFSVRECVHGKYCRMCTLMLVITNQPVYFKHCKISTAMIKGV